MNIRRNVALTKERH